MHFLYVLHLEVSLYLSPQFQHYTYTPCVARCFPKTLTSRVKINRQDNSNPTLSPEINSDLNFR